MFISIKTNSTLDKAFKAFAEFISEELQDRGTFQVPTCDFERAVIEMFAEHTDHSAYLNSRLNNPDQIVTEFRCTYLLEGSIEITDHVDGNTIFDATNRDIDTLNILEMAELVNELVEEGIADQEPEETEEPEEFEETEEPEEFEETEEPEEFEETEDNSLDDEFDEEYDEEIDEEIEDEIEEEIEDEIEEELEDETEEDELSRMFDSIGDTGLIDDDLDLEDEEEEPAPVKRSVKKLKIKKQGAARKSTVETSVTPKKKLGSKINRRNRK